MRSGGEWLAFQCTLPAVAVAIALLVPFLGKGFTIDDVTFLLQARHILSDPLHPTAFDMVFEGERIRLSRELVSGPVMAYLLVPAVKSGAMETVAHLTQLVLLLAAAFATAALGLHLGLNRFQARIASLLLVTAPAVATMASTGMPDVPAMAFGVMGIERFVAWRSGGKWHAGVLAAVSLALAALARPHALLLLPVAAILPAISTKRRKPASRDSAFSVGAITPLIAALLFIAGIVVLTRDPASGTSVANATAGRIDLEMALWHLSDFALHWALVFPLVLLWPLLRGSAFLSPLRTLGSAIAALVLAVTGGYVRADLLPSVAFIFALTLAIDVLVDIARDGVARRDRLQLALWCWLMIGVSTSVYVQLPAKLLLPSAPAMALLISGRLAQETLPIRQKAGLAVATGMCIILSVLLLRADADLADIGRRGGRLVAEQVGQGNTVWMDGGWGFQWYAMEAGAVPVAKTAPFPKRGDLVVFGPQGRLIRAFHEKTMLHREIFANEGGRIQGDGAGFYSKYSGLLPWAWGDGEYGRLEVWRIDGPPPTL